MGSQRRNGVTASGMREGARDVAVALQSGKLGFEVIGNVGKDGWREHILAGWKGPVGRRWNFHEID